MQIKWALPRPNTRTNSSQLRRACVAVTVATLSPAAATQANILTGYYVLDKGAARTVARYGTDLTAPPTWSVGVTSVENMVVGDDGFVYAGSEANNGDVRRIDALTGLVDANDNDILGTPNPTGTNVQIKAMLLGPDANGDAVRDLYVSGRSHGISIWDISAGVGTDATLLAELAPDGTSNQSWYQILNGAALPENGNGIPATTNGGPWAEALALGPDGRVYGVSGGNNNTENYLFRLAITPGSPPTIGATVNAIWDLNPRPNGAIDLVFNSEGNPVVTFSNGRAIEELVLGDGAPSNPVSQLYTPSLIANNADFGAFDPHWAYFSPDDGKYYVGTRTAGGIAGQIWSFDVDGTTGELINGVQLLAPSDGADHRFVVIPIFEIPEPGSLGLLGAMGAMALLRRRRP
jgi:hypothetical protein